MTWSVFIVLNEVALYKFLSCYQIEGILLSNQLSPWSSASSCNTLRQLSCIFEASKPQVALRLATYPKFNKINNRNLHGKERE